MNTNKLSKFNHFTTSLNMLYRIKCSFNENSIMNKTDILETNTDSTTEKTNTSEDFILYFVQYSILSIAVKNMVILGFIPTIIEVLSSILTKLSLSKLGQENLSKDFVSIFAFLYNQTEEGKYKKIKSMQETLFKEIINNIKNFKFIALEIEKIKDNIQQDLTIKKEEKKIILGYLKYEEIYEINQKNLYSLFYQMALLTHKFISNVISQNNNTEFENYTQILDFMQNNPTIQVRLCKESFFLYKNLINKVNEIIQNIDHKINECIDEYKECINIYYNQNKDNQINEFGNYIKKTEED